MPGTIRAVIFDMDGLLVDSEPFWRRAHVLTLAKLGITIREDDVREVTGMRTPEAVAYWYARHAWTGPSTAEVAEAVISTVIELIRSESQPMPGVRALLSLLSQRELPLAIASSSSMRVIDFIVTHFEFKQWMRVIRSAEHEPYGKPHPAVYLTTAQELDIEPQHCLVFEDSINGVLAAKAARMKCIAVPDTVQRQDRRFGIADMVLHSLEDVTAGLLERL